MPSPLVVARMDERSYNRAVERLKKYEGRPFTQRMTKAYEAGGRLLVAPMRRSIDATITGHGRTPGLLRRKVSMRKRRPPPRYFIQVGTKSRAPHAGLVSKGHRLPSGGRTAARPFVENTIQRYEGRVIRFIESQVGAEGARTFAGTVGRF